ncbi:MAG: HAMP domain-containing histidine kinase [Lautropia sp.]|nr:HAMP domain-containing histidine kinase [Lautropia sp.]
MKSSRRAQRRFRPRQVHGNSGTGFARAVSGISVSNALLGRPDLSEPDGTSRPEGRSKTSLGLGLFIVREIVVGHDGTISVESAADTGTVFTIRLPVPRGLPTSSPAVRE